MANKQAKILVIAGSDSGGGAGIQADIKSIAANGAYASTAITSITAQNTLGVQAVSDVPLEILRAQIDSVLSDIGADIIKTGMLSSIGIIGVVSDVLSQHKIPLVLDPVMVAKGGAKLLRDDAIDALKALIGKAYLITPNIPEAEILSCIKINNVTDMEKAGQFILSSYGCKAVLMKGGHMQGDILTDVLLAPDINIKIDAARINTRNTHGTGCSYASAIAAHLAKGQGLEQAVRASHAYLQGAIRAAVPVGAGHSPIAHFWNINN